MIEDMTDEELKKLRRAHDMELAKLSERANWLETEIENISDELANREKPTKKE